MQLNQWINENITNYNTTIKSEEDLKVKVIIPYLYSLGYDEEDLRYENSIDVNIGTKKTTVYSDIEVLINDSVEMVIDTKNPKNLLAERDVLQVVSYAKLINTPHALYGSVVNGKECIVIDAFTGRRFSEIPSKGQLLRDINKSKKPPLKSIEIREVESVLFTLTNTDELYKIIKKCKDVIETRGLIRSDQSFREMTKILLVKMNEERRVKVGQGNNRFTYEQINVNAKVNKTNELTIVTKLFDEAKNEYPGIYTKDDEQIEIKDNDCIISLVKSLEPFSFIGTGDDIKGTVYEIFLKATLRGEFDQYFTPRELVEFIVKCADPKIGDVILDPACGSGGFLIQAFNYVNAKINSSGLPELDCHNKFNSLIHKCLWGHEADYDLHVLAKINLIMHGDGWNNIYQGDTLKSKKLKDNFFDLILTNPPFTIPYTFPDVLEKYELGRGKVKEELDILFVEKSINLLKPGSDMYIVLPEGLMNNKRYSYFREWLLSKAYLLYSVSLPEGAFIPFGGSVSKTCILGLRKKGLQKPAFAFLGNAMEVGYQLAKKSYIKCKKNCLAEFAYLMNEVFDGVKLTSNGGECGWIEQDKISSYRIDANFLLNKIDNNMLSKTLGYKMIPLKEVCQIDNITVTINGNEKYYYLEVPDISPITGVITNVRKVDGNEIGDSFHKFESGDILFTRINPRISRVAIAPPLPSYGVVSKEVYRIKYKKNEYIKEKNFYVLQTMLQLNSVQKQIVRLSTGSSSSRARVQETDLLENVFIPIISEKEQENISKSNYLACTNIWKQSQNYLKIFEANQKVFGGNINKNYLRSI